LGEHRLLPIWWTQKLVIHGCLPADIGPVAAKPGDLPLYSRRIHVKYRSGQELLLCPLKWLDSFSMRNFTNDQIFDDTLPLGDGLLEAGARVPLDRLRDAMEDWFRRKGYLPKDASLVVEEASPQLTSNPA
jgi:hypothetical protein